MGFCPYFSLWVGGGEGREKTCGNFFVFHNGGGEGGWRSRSCAVERGAEKKKRFYRESFPEREIKMVSSSTFSSLFGVELCLLVVVVSFLAKKDLQSCRGPQDRVYI